MNSSIDWVRNLYVRIGFLIYNFEVKYKLLVYCRIHFESEIIHNLFQLHPCYIRFNAYFPTNYQTVSSKSIQQNPSVEDCSHWASQEIPSCYEIRLFVTFKLMILWDVTTCSLVYGPQHIVGTCCLHIYHEDGSSEVLYNAQPSTILHGSKSQKAVILIQPLEPQILYLLDHKKPITGL
jgi:hypothetical protein